MKKVLGKTPTGLATKTKSGESRYFAGPLVLKAEELKKLKPALKIRAINEMLNKFANYAINKTYTKKPSKNPIVNSLKGAGELYAKAQKAFLPTMGGTEAKSRSIEKKINTEKFWVEKNSFNHNEDQQLDRKRSHKRRRKMRKPMKGLR